MRVVSVRGVAVASVTCEPFTVLVPGSIDYLVIRVGH